MKALPFPCIRPADDRVLDALANMGAILASGDGIQQGLAAGLLLKDPGAAYYLYERRDDSGTRTAVLANVPVAQVEAALDKPATPAADAPSPGVASADDILDLKVQPRPTTLSFQSDPVMQIIVGAAKEGAALYDLVDPAGIKHRFWEVKRPDAVDALRAMLEQAPAPTAEDDAEQARFAVAAARRLIDRAKSEGAYSGKEPFNFILSALFPQKNGASTQPAPAPRAPLGLIMHQVARF